MKAKVSVLETTPSGNFNWSELDQINSQTLADLWASGRTVAAHLAPNAGKSSTLKFQSANVLMVRIPLDQLPLEAVMAADFTKRYATVTANSEDDSGRGQLLLAFQLPEPVTSASVYVRLLAGLETLYAGAVRHSCAEQGYGLANGGTATVLGGKLDTEAVRHLDDIGTETKELRKGRGAYLRSRVTLDKTTVIKLPDGEAYPLEQLPKDLSVFCPVHIGAVPTGIVHWYADGTPGVQCSHCKRTYAAPTTQRDYDFGFFDRTVKALAEVEMASTVVSSGIEFATPGVKYIAEKYLPAIALEAGATFIKSPKGTGKTEALVALVEQCKKKHLRVLLLGHRRSLLQSISARLGLDCYFVMDDSEAVGSDTMEQWEFDHDLDESGKVPDPILKGESREEGRYQSVAPTKHYAICLDSMVNLDPEDEKRQYQLIIIDEAEQVFAHLTGETLKAQRREVFAKLSYYLRKAQQVVLLDADLNMVTMTAAFELLPPAMPARIIVNEPKATQGDIHLYSNRGQLAKLLTDKVGGGQKLFVATNSKRKAVDLSKLILERHPGKRVEVITSDNSQRPETQKLLGDITRKFEDEIDVLIASPAIGTGIDITFKDQDGNPRKVVDGVFGFFEANIVTHFDIDQQLMRVRHPGEVHVWVDATAMNYETDVGCIKRELEKTVRKTGYLLRYDDDGHPVFASDNGLVNIWARVMAASRGSKNRLADYFRDLRAEGGWNLVDVDYDEGQAAFGRAAMAAAKQARLTERMEKLLAADKLAPDEAAKLEARDKRGLPLSDKEREALGRYQIEGFYADGEISPELIDFDDDGRMRERVARLECLTSKREWYEIRDERDVEDGVLVFDRKRYLAQRDTLESILAASGLFDLATRKFKSDMVVEAASLDAFLRELEMKRRQFELLFGVPIYADCWRKPVVQLKCILGLVGLDLANVKTEQKDGKKVRRYGIPAEMLDRMIRAVKKRDLKYRRDTAVCSSEDKLTRLSSKEMAAGLADFIAKRPKAASSVSAEKRLAVTEAFRQKAA